jgi:hypothetical protein
MNFPAFLTGGTLISRGLVLCLLLALGSGCSRSEFAYRNADWFIERYARHAVDLSDTQREQWQPVVQATLHQHREEVMPLVIGYLDTLQQAIQQPADAAVIECLVRGASDLYDRHAELAAGLAAPLLSRLDDAQIRHLGTYLSGKNAELRERYHDPDPERRHSARVERISGRIERWTGRLSGTQQLQIAQDIRRIPDLTDPWLANRTEQGEALVLLLKDGADDADIRNHLYRWWVGREGLPASAVRDWETARTGFTAMLHSLGISMSTRQRTTFERRVTDLREDLAVFLPDAHPPQQQAIFTCTPPAA